MRGDFLLGVPVHGSGNYVVLLSPCKFKIMTDLVYTKPPWSRSPQGTYIRSGGVHGWNIATVHDQPPYTEGNRALIQKSPKMYEMLLEIIKTWDSAQAIPKYRRELEDDMFKVIQKAKILIKNI